MGKLLKSLILYLAIFHPARATARPDQGSSALTLFGQTADDRALKDNTALMLAPSYYENYVEADPPQTATLLQDEQSAVSETSTDQPLQPQQLDSVSATTPMIHNQPVAKLEGECRNNAIGISSIKKICVTKDNQTFYLKQLLMHTAGYPGSPLRYDTHGNIFFYEAFKRDLYSKILHLKVPDYKFATLDGRDIHMVSPEIKNLVSPKNQCLTDSMLSPGAIAETLAGIMFDRDMHEENLKYTSGDSAVYLDIDNFNLPPNNADDYINTALFSLNRLRIGDYKYHLDITRQTLLETKKFFEKIRDENAPLPESAAIFCLTDNDWKQHLDIYISAIQRTFESAVSDRDELLDQLRRNISLEFWLRKHSISDLNALAAQEKLLSNPGPVVKKEIHSDNPFLSALPEISDMEEPQTLHDFLINRYFDRHIPPIEHQKLFEEMCDGLKLPLEFEYKSTGYTFHSLSDVLEAEQKEVKFEDAWEVTVSLGGVRLGTACYPKVEEARYVAEITSYDVLKRDESLIKKISEKYFERNIKSLQPR